MKLFLFCLFAVFFLGSLAAPVSREKKKLKELLFQLNQFTKSLQPSEWNMELPTPPMDIEDCCSLPALECFRDILNIHFNITQDLMKSLDSKYTRKGLTFLGETEAKSTCRDCASHPKERADKFFERLESLVQKGISW